MMISMSFKVQKTAFKKPTGIENKARAKMSSWASETERITSKYPPPPGGSTYVRTGRLGAGWRSSTQDKGGGIVSEVNNNVEYAKYVHGGKFGYIGWKTLDDIAAEQWDKTKSALQKVFDDLKV